MRIVNELVLGIRCQLTACGPDSVRRARLRDLAGAIPAWQRVAPAGSSQSGGGGNQFVEAFDGTGVDRSSQPTRMPRVFGREGEGRPLLRFLVHWRHVQRSPFGSVNVVLKLAISLPALLIKFGKQNKLRDVQPIKMSKVYIVKGQSLRAALSTERDVIVGYSNQRREKSCWQLVTSHRLALRDSLESSSTEFVSLNRFEAAPLLFQAAFCRLHT